MRIWLYEVGENLIINEKVKRYLPHSVGKEVNVIEKLTNGSFDYLVVDNEGNEYRVRETELNRLGENAVTNNTYRHKQLIEEIHNTYKIKNADYGNSFGDQFEEHGLLSAVIRLDDKMRRLKTLSKQEAQVKDESIRDTVLDLANYAIMTVMELDKQIKK